MGNNTIEGLLSLGLGSGGGGGGMLSSWSYGSSSATGLVVGGGWIAVSVSDFCRSMLVVLVDMKALAIRIFCARNSLDSFCSLGGSA